MGFHKRCLKASQRPTLGTKIMNNGDGHIGRLRRTRHYHDDIERI